MKATTCGGHVATMCMAPTFCERLQRAPMVLIAYMRVTSCTKYIVTMVLQDSCSDCVLTDGFEAA
jgi:hypothetical protein